DLVPQAGVCVALEKQDREATLWLTWSNACLGPACSKQDDLTFSVGLESQTNNVIVAFRTMRSSAESDRANGANASVGVRGFTRSYDLAPRPLTLFNLAGAQVITGKLVAASESYRRFVRDTPAGIHQSYKEEAERALRTLEARIPSIRVTASGLGARDEILLD